MIHSFANSVSSGYYRYSYSQYSMIISQTGKFLKTDVTSDIFFVAPVTESFVVQSTIQAHQANSMQECLQKGINYLVPHQCHFLNGNEQHYKITNF